MAVLLVANPVLSFEPTFRLTEITEFSESYMNESKPKALK
jgi:hypothetical protein